MNSYVIYLAPALGVLGLLVMAMKSAWVGKQDPGDANMQELAGHIADGAMAFLKAEWRGLSIFFVVTAAFLGHFRAGHTIHRRGNHPNWGLFIAVFIGAGLFATAWFFGVEGGAKAK